jgi:hypothetical protein
MKKIPVPPAGFAMVPAETIDARMRRRANASKYTPHFGAKQAEKLAPRHA